MKFLDAIARWMPPPRLTTGRILAAFAVALAADAVQVALIPLGPVGLIPDEAIDIIAMALTCWLLGFHVLLLPTFVIELVPVVGMLPTWTGCVAAVVALRRSAQRRDGASAVVTTAQPAGMPPQLPPPLSMPPKPSEGRREDGAEANPS